MHPLQLNEGQMQGKENNKHQRQDGHVNAEETGQGGAGNFVAAAQQNQHGFADKRNCSHNLGAHFGGKEGQFIPG